MNEKEQNFFDSVYDIFYKFGQIKPENIAFVFSRKIQFPTIEQSPKLKISIPLPKKQNDTYVFEGAVFDDTEDGRKSMWCLFLASIYHMSAHASMSDYSIYEKWKKNKTLEVCTKVIDFIEDINVEKYIRHTNPEIWQNIENINSILLSSEKSQNNKTISGELYLKPFHATENEEILKKIKLEMEEKNTDIDYCKKMISFADFLYKNRELLSKDIFPYCEHHGYYNEIKIDKKGIEFEANGEDFKSNVDLLDELWVIDQQVKEKILRKFKKHLKNANFDSVVIPSGNFQSFLQTKLKVLPMVKRIRQQLQMVTNMNDDTKIESIGYVDLQLAIQIMSSEGQSQDIFQRDELNRGEEAWVILVDASSSMKLRFEQIKEFTLCVAESANELTKNSNAWALYSFNNNFQIIKDFKEKYNKEVKARIGSLENGGLSLLPDAIELASRILAEDPRERKHLFVITDGHPTGYERIQEAFSKVVKRTEVSDITLIAIGVSKSLNHSFKNTVKGRNLRQLVAKFITAYRLVSE